MRRATWLAIQIRLKNLQTDRCTVTRYGKRRFSLSVYILYLLVSDYFKRIFLDGQWWKFCSEFLPVKI